MKALIISADNFEDTELLVPYYRLKEEGVDVDIASISKGKIKGKHGYEVEANKSLKEIKPDDYDILILPGGKAPETIRKEKLAQDIARHFFERNKPVAAICHDRRHSFQQDFLKEGMQPVTGQLQRNSRHQAQYMRTKRWWLMEISLLQDSLRTYQLF